MIEIERLDRGACDMRRKKNVGECRESQIEVRFAAIDIETPCEEMAGLQRLDQRILIDKRAARRVHEDRAACAIPHA
jgi:hypothetical protein